MRYSYSDSALCTHQPDPAQQHSQSNEEYWSPVQHYQEPPQYQFEMEQQSEMFTHPDYNQAGAWSDRNSTDMYVAIADYQAMDNVSVSLSSGQRVQVRAALSLLLTGSYSIPSRCLTALVATGGS